MFAQEIWRYPVKSMAGELLLSTQLTEQGVPGDRVLQVRDSQGRILTSRTHPGLLGLHATTGFEDIGGRHAAVAHENVTQRKQAETALKSTQAQLLEPPRQPYRPKRIFKND